MPITYTSFCVTGSSIFAALPRFRYALLIPFHLKTAGQRAPRAFPMTLEFITASTEAELGVTLFEADNNPQLLLCPMA